MHNPFANAAYPDAEDAKPAAVGKLLTDLMVGYHLKYCDTSWYHFYFVFYVSEICINSDLLHLSNY